MTDTFSFISPWADLILRALGTVVGCYGLAVIAYVWGKHQKINVNVRGYGYAASAALVASVASGALIESFDVDIRYEREKKKNAQLTGQVVALKKTSASGEAARKLLKSMTAYQYAKDGTAMSALAWSANSAPLDVKVLGAFGIKATPAYRITDFKPDNTVVFKTLGLPLNKTHVNQWTKDAGVNALFLKSGKFN